LSTGPLRLRPARRRSADDPAWRAPEVPAPAQRVSARGQPGESAGTIPAPGSPHRHFAICPRGLETPLTAELAALGATGIEAVPGGVGFDGDRALACRANLHSRIASRILRRLDVARYRDDDDLYKLAARTPWESLIRVDATLRVDVTAARASLRSLNFATLRIKDGIVDRLRDQTGSRPSIDTRTPGTRVFAYLDERTVTLYLDLSGEPLFKRGWRSGVDDKGEAPLKENLAAGLLALAGWQPSTPLYDPFCGSGTIVIEAAQIAAGIAPGLSRSFGFERLPDHDPTLWATIRGDALRAMTGEAGRPAGAPSWRIAASDVDPQAVEQTRRNLERAGLPADAVQVSPCDFADARPPFDGPGMIVCNPPYGERIALQGGADFGQFGEVLKARFGGWHAWLLSSDRELPRWLGMKERRKTPLYNGPLECRLFGFEIFAPAGADARHARGV
jgi:putative N6-adenine-specific DNA methylase